jgi:hypothetical protein
MDTTMAEAGGDILVMPEDLQGGDKCYAWKNAKR